MTLENKLKKQIEIMDLIDEIKKLPIDKSKHLRHELFREIKEYYKKYNERFDYVGSKK